MKLAGIIKTFCALCVVLLILLTAQASAMIFNLYGINHDVSANVYASWHNDYLNIELENTTTAYDTSLITGFGFNVLPGNDWDGYFKAKLISDYEEATNLGFDADKWQAGYDLVMQPNIQQSFDLGAFVGKKLFAGDPKGGIHSGGFGLHEKALFTFGFENLSELDLAYLKDANPFEFAARFQAIGPDDLSDVAVVPIPGAVWLLGSGFLGLMGLRRRFNK